MTTVPRFPTLLVSAAMAFLSISLTFRLADYRSFEHPDQVSDAGRAHGPLNLGSQRDGPWRVYFEEGDRRVHLLRFHTRTAPSCPAVASRLPSGENCMLRTPGFVCARHVLHNAASLRRHTRTRPQSPRHARYLPSELTAV